MALNPLAGQPPPPSQLVNVPRLITAYYAEKPDVSVAAQKVSFGTSGHRGSSFDCSFNEDHILAITQAICQYREESGVDGPLFLAKDTHALSEPAFASALEVLAANGVEVMVDQDLGYTPTPALSHAILTYNRGTRRRGLADGIVITPSHNPPEDGGFKYNPPNGGPADTDGHQVDREPRQRNPARPDLAGVRRVALRQGARRLHHAPPRLHLGVRQRPRRRDRPRRHSRRPPYRSASIRWAAPASPTGPASPSATGSPITVAHAQRRPHLPLHDARLGRQDPHGLLVALRHGRPDRA